MVQLTPEAQAILDKNRAKKAKKEPATKVAAKEKPIPLKSDYLGSAQELGDTLAVMGSGLTAGAGPWAIEKLSGYPARQKIAEAKERLGPINAIPSEMFGAVAPAVFGIGLPALAARTPGLLGGAARTGLAAAEGAGYGATSAAIDLDETTSPLMGGALGAGLGAGGALLGEGVGAGARLLRGTTAADEVGRIAAGQSQARQNLAGLGREGMVADVLGEPGRTLTRKTADMSPEARQILENALQERLARQPENLVSAVEEAANIAPQHRLTPEELVEQLREARRPAINEAYQEAQEAGFHLPRETRSRTIQEPVPPGTAVAERATGGTVERRMGLQFASARGDITPAIKINGQIHTTPNADRHQTVMADLVDKHYFDPEMSARLENLDEDAFGFINKNGEFKTRDAMADELGLGVGPSTVPPQTRSRVIEEETEIPSFFADLINTPSGSSAWRRAGTSRRDWEATHGPIVNSDLWRLDETMKTLQGRAEAARRQGNRPQAEKFGSLARAFRERMDGLLELPEYAQARALHRGMEEEISGIRRGAELAGNRYAPTLTREAIAAREGPRGALLGAAQAQGYGHAKAAQLLGDRSLASSTAPFRSTLGQEGAQAALGDRASIVEEAVRRADIFRDTAKVPSGGSQTSRNSIPIIASELAKQLSAPALVGGLTLAHGLATGDASAYKTASAVVLTMAAKYGLNKLQARQLSTHLPEIARILVGQEIPATAPFRSGPASQIGSAVAKGGGLLGAQ